MAEQNLEAAKLLAQSFLRVNSSVIEIWLMYISIIQVHTHHPLHDHSLCTRVLKLLVSCDMFRSMPASVLLLLFAFPLFPQGLISVASLPPMIPVRAALSLDLPPSSEAEWRCGRGADLRHGRRPLPQPLRLLALLRVARAVARETRLCRRSPDPLCPTAVLTGTSLPSLSTVLYYLWWLIITGG